VYVGLDYHAAFVQVCVLDATGRQLVNRRCPNSVESVAAAVGPGWTVGAAALESCCGAADLCAALREHAGWPAVLAHPGYVARMKRSPDKSDYSDARMLAELCRVGMVPTVHLPSGDTRDLRTLVRLRADLVGRVRAVKTRLLGLLRLHRVREDAGVGRWSKRWLIWLRSGPDGLSADAMFAVEMELGELEQLRERVARVERRLAERTIDDAVVQRLLGIKGIGPVTAWTMRAVIGEFSRFASGKHLARFCAVTPRNASSGMRVGDAGLIKAGDPVLKTVIVEAAQRLRRYDPRWRELSARLAARGKPTSVIVAAVANRWVRSIFHQLGRPAPEVNAAA
jgi:transposase